MAQNKNKGWTVTMAGLGINLALGILYTWSIFKLSIKESIVSGDGRFDWALASLNDPYAVCCLVFAFSMVIAGRVQDRVGPKLTAMIGGILTGLGLIWISQSYSLASWVLGFGLLTGAGLGFGYASATPPALKWFPSSKTGMIAGLVVSGFGLASVYIAPLANYLIGHYGLSTAISWSSAAASCWWSAFWPSFSSTRRWASSRRKTLRLARPPSPRPKAWTSCPVRCLETVISTCSGSSSPWPRARGS